MSLIVLSHLILTPSARASSASKAWAAHVGAVAAVDDQRLLGPEALRAVRAASIAVLPPP